MYGRPTLTTSQTLVTNQSNEQYEKPLLVNASGDFSNVKIIQYKSRFLYSKYNPFKSIVSIIQNSIFLEGSIIVICAPCLWYGLEVLMQKLPAACKIIAIQDDEQLLYIAQQAIPQEYRNKITLCGTNNLLELDGYIRDLVQTGTYKRAVRIDFSAGIQLNVQMYNAVFAGIQEITASFWMNRITLVKMGRLFSKNVFQNLPMMADGLQLSEVCKSVDKPIIVCGAGESLDSTPKEIIENCFVIAVDAALIAILRRNIHVDAVVSLESQYVIQKAYIGVQEFQDDIILFADIASRPSVVRSIKNKTVWFASEYTNAKFLANLKQLDIIDDFIQPLGSVGLAATLIALKLRQSQDVPVFITGLDFSYSIGLTHAKGTPAHATRLFSTNKLFPVENYDAAFASGVFPIANKSKHTMMTSKSMKSYSDSFAATFNGVQNLFDLGKTGIPLNIPFITENIAEELIKKADTSTNLLLCTHKKVERKNNIAKFYSAERTALETIKDLLKLGENSSKRELNISLDEQLKKLLQPREYLYLHFPDGYAFSTEISFLKRVRAEIDFFLKQIPQQF